MSAGASRKKPGNVRTTLTPKNDSYRVEKTVYPILDLPVFHVGEKARPFGLIEVQNAENLDQ